MAVAKAVVVGIKVASEMGRHRICRKLKKILSHDAIRRQASISVMKADTREPGRPDRYIPAPA